MNDWFTRIIILLSALTVVIGLSSVPSEIFGFFFCSWQSQEVGPLRGVVLVSDWSLHDSRGDIHIGRVCSWSTKITTSLGLSFLLSNFSASKFDGGAMYYYFLLRISLLITNTITTRKIDDRRCGRRRNNLLLQYLVGSSLWAPRIASSYPTNIKYQRFSKSLPGLFTLTLSTSSQNLSQNMFSFSESISSHKLHLCKIIHNG